ncbi:MAG: class I SAM-dependent methyltransferase [Planctomycetaceae bacterium]|nr:MAG: class I SAM-dependent methyltransferase [Planctomycetaceae bacterium]
MASNSIEDRSSAAAPHASRLYRELVPAYEALWPMVARRRIRSVIRGMKFQPGQRVLEVGVGTGMSLTAYPRDIDLTGVDLSEDMLAQAEKLIEDERLSHIRVMPMNAEQLEFEDSSFDVVTSFHVISVVSEPRRMMGEMLRVCKPGGLIVMINHFRSNNPWIAKMVDSAGSVTRHLGWRTDLSLDEVVAEMPLRLERRYKTSPTSLFTIIKATKLDPNATNLPS